MGIPPLTTFQFDDDNSLKMQTLFNQEMLYRGYLASNHVYTCSHHTDQVIDEYLEAVADVFKIVACAQEQDKYNDLLHGPVISKGFKRLN
jgi:glutamate-1-semialdehyde 2,1-aminomutase